VVILFDLDETLLDHRTTERAAATALHRIAGLAKPSPAIFLLACERMGAPPATTIYVGDRYDVDAEGARRAGLRGVWLDRGRAARGEHAPPIISTLEELDALL
jgi:putative hydrolase of the HAD superfamily